MLLSTLLTGENSNWKLFWWENHIKNMEETAFLCYFEEIIIFLGCFEEETSFWGYFEEKMIFQGCFEEEDAFSGTFEVALKKNS